MTDTPEAVMARAMAIDAWVRKGYSAAQVADWWDVGRGGCISNKPYWQKHAAAAHVALRAAGFAIVPVEPTEKMVRVAQSVCDLVLGESANLPCDCGHDGLMACLAKLDGAQK